MPSVRFLRTVSLNKGETGGVHLGFEVFEAGQVVELNEASVARWLKRGAVEVVETPVPALAPLPPVAPTSKRDKTSPVVAPATAQEPLPPLGEPSN